MTSGGDCPFRFTGIDTITGEEHVDAPAYFAPRPPITGGDVCVICHDTRHFQHLTTPLVSSSGVRCKCRFYIHPPCQESNRAATGRPQCPICRKMFNPPSPVHETTEEEMLNEMMAIARQHRTPPARERDTSLEREERPAEQEFAADIARIRRDLLTSPTLQPNSDIGFRMMQDYFDLAAASSEEEQAEPTPVPTPPPTIWPRMPLGRFYDRNHQIFIFPARTFREFYASPRTFVEVENFYRALGLTSLDLIMAPTAKIRSTLLHMLFWCSLFFLCTAIVWWFYIPENVLLVVAYSFFILWAAVLFPPSLISTIHYIREIRHFYSDADVLYEKRCREREGIRGILPDFL